MNARAAICQVGAGVLPELLLIFRWQGSVPLEKKATFKGGVRGLTALLSSPFFPDSTPKSPKILSFTTGKSNKTSSWQVNSVSEFMEAFELSSETEGWMKCFVWLSILCQFHVIVSPTCILIKALFFPDLSLCR